MRPLSRTFTRRLSWLGVAAWIVTMGLLVQRTYLQASAANLATDLARYGTQAQWRGVYYRGEKIGFTVGQVVPTADGFELHEDGRLQMSLLGATTPAIIKTTARVDTAFALRSFEFSLDPGTGPLTLAGRLDGVRLTLQITSGAGTRTEVRTLAEPPALIANLGRRLASAGLAEGGEHRLLVFDPATLSNSPVTVKVGRREVVMTGGRPTPAFRAALSFAGITTTSWITDTGEVIREESPLGLLSVREPQEQAVQLAVSSRVQADLLAAAAVVPTMRARIDEPRDVVRLRLQVSGIDPSPLVLDGVGQTWTPDVLEVADARQLRPGPADAALAEYLRPEPLIESDDPAIVAEAERMVAGATSPRERAERLVRGVNGLLDKSPTISVPSAREVLRTKVGDCNEHTALFVALARAVGLPTRINVGLAWVLGAFYYHAWPEVYLEDADGRGHWLPVDPTFNQFPADATHVRLLRGGLDKQAAILPLIGRLQLTVLEVELSPDAVVRTAMPAAAPAEGPPLAMPLAPPARPAVAGGGCWLGRWFAHCRGTR
ncbi:MAG: transglutaminase family protein [Vicinamibacterales bacterium]